MANQAKLLRNQMRNIVKELFPEIVSSELYAKIEKQNKEQLEFLFNLVKGTLSRVEERQKDLQSLIMREVANATKVVPTEDKKAE